MALTKYRLGDFIERSTINNKDEKYNTKFIAGVSNEGVFTAPKGNPEGVNLKPYKIVNNGAFVYNPSRLDLGSIAYRTEGTCIVSPFYIVFYLNEEGKKKIDPLYLFMFFKRSEFNRYARFNSWGSVREAFSWNEMQDIEIELPSLSVQQKYVDIYNSILENQKCYETALDDLKLVCDAYIEDLRRIYPSQKIGKYIQRHDIRNKNNSIKNVMGISTAKEFRKPSAKVNKNELSNYKIVKPRQIGFVQTTHNEKVFTYAFNNTSEDIVISSVNEVFSCDEQSLLPEYLSMFFNRTEFDRYARFHSWGTAREIFTWKDVCDVEIPIPDIEIQRYVVNIYKAYIERKQINEHLKAQIKDLCPVLIRGSLSEERW